MNASGSGRPSGRGPLAPVLTLTLRAVMEAGTVGALGYWGYRSGAAPVSRAVLAVCAPAVAFFTWGALDFRSAGRHAEWLRHAEELVLSTLASVALYASGQRVLGVALGLLSAVYHGLVYLLGGRLLRPSARPLSPRPPAVATSEVPSAAGIGRGRVQRESTSGP